MGEIEERVKVRRRKQNIRFAILSAIKIAGMLSVAVIAPNALQLLRYTHNKKSQYKSRVLESLERLEKNGYVKKGSDGKFQITQKGEILLLKFSNNTSVKKHKKWDRKWRVVIFDIPEQRKLSRDNLRLALKSVGFAKLQNSVWVFPYDCEDILALLKTNYRLGKEVQYMVVEELEEDRQLRKLFKIKEKRR
ncbi:hypothetical protein COU13_01310 [Candidatus Kaiserbacteria bacterium CG10_big_fil_rev_8_21_14_0_10_43_70]|uniref:Transcriptional repressor PaaX-like central Cas2-like domain-containing protein n=1 Tax=Candidatus Kaiserbacteria bacterium CG10_big_fil_rev_8_21_14_0_10_43_70 TaxID=1974605 RepID=A0A2H0UIZ8_9BACT|nr:MAG: hypothetical protein COU13_01310 [Candidatus Kaiserbacteria bacterium CG10_big_fil_rev_8_21_14_0_10_43_70]